MDAATHGEADAALLIHYRRKWLGAIQPPSSLPSYELLSGAAESGSGLQETDARQIETDLARSSVQTLPISEEDLPGHTSRLRRLLRAWCVLRPDWGYSQAMNFSAAVALCVAGGDEASAFTLFVALIDRLPIDFYAESPPLRGFQVELETLTTREFLRATQ